MSALLKEAREQKEGADDKCCPEHPLIPDPSEKRLQGSAREVVCFDVHLVAMDQPHRGPLVAGTVGVQCEAGNTIREDQALDFTPAGPGCCIDLDISRRVLGHVVATPVDDLRNTTKSDIGGGLQDFAKDLCVCSDHNIVIAVYRIDDDGAGNTAISRRSHAPFYLLLRGTRFRRIGDVAAR